MSSFGKALLISIGWFCFLSLVWGKGNKVKTDSHTSLELNKAGQVVIGTVIAWTAIPLIYFAFLKS